MATRSIVCWLRVCVVREARDENQSQLLAHASFAAVPLGVSG